MSNPTIFVQMAILPALNCQRKHYLNQNNIIYFLQGQENGLENGHNGTEVSVSGLAHIDYTGNNPFELFKEWHGEARASTLVNPDALCFTSCST